MAEILLTYILHMFVILHCKYNVIGRFVFVYFYVFDTFIEIIVSHFSW